MEFLKDNQVMHEREFDTEVLVAFWKVKKTKKDQPKARYHRYRYERFRLIIARLGYPGF